MSTDETTKEHNRLGHLHDLGILDSAQESAFDRLVDMAALLFDVPIALISLIDEKRQWFKAKHGLAVCETPKEWSVCQYVVRDGSPLQIKDLTQDERVKASPLVTGDSHLRFYAGHPIKNKNGSVLGSFCVIDTQPRYDWSEKKSALLSYFAQLCEREIEVRTMGRDMLELISNPPRHHI